VKCAWPPRPAARWVNSRYLNGADDGASGVYLAMDTRILRLGPGGKTQLLGVLPFPIKGLARFGDGVVALLKTQEPSTRPSPVTAGMGVPLSIYEVSEAGNVAPWRFARLLQTPLLITSAPGKGLVAVDGGDYTTRVVQIETNGTSKVLMRSERAQGRPGGYQILGGGGDCPRDPRPRSFAPAALTSGADGQIATVFNALDELVVWHP
jgi:hypothetical protein